MRHCTVVGWSATARRPSARAARGTAVRSMGPGGTATHAADATGTPWGAPMRADGKPSFSAVRGLGAVRRARECLRDERVAAGGEGSARRGTGWGGQKLLVNSRSVERPVAKGHKGCFGT